MSQDDETRTAARRGALDEPTGTRLVVVSGSTILTLPLPATGAVVIGRASDADVTIDDDTLSRRHARLTLSSPALLEDLDSHNGTRVDGVEVDGPTEVSPGDVIELGDVTVMLQESAASSQAGARRLLEGARAEATHPPARRGRVVGPWLERAWPILERIARGRISVLLLGETGAGKEVMAQLIHDASPRADRELVAINCTALPEQLLESALFGHEKGAFTGATSAKSGLLEEADGSTLFLDEIGDLSPALQAKLLRVLEDRRFMRVGATKTQSVDVRYVAATNRDLAAEVEAGRFRKDLYYRLNAFTFRIPPLRERVDEIAELAAQFVAISTPDGEEPPILGEEAARILRAHDWPGNVRELRNVVERATLLATSGVIEPEHLPEELVASAPEAPPEGDLQQAIDTAERERIIAALADCGGNQTRAAKALGISRRTLVSRLRRYGIRRPRG